MKNILITIALALAVCAAAFGAVYALQCEPAVHRAAREGDAMQWLRAEFKLNDAQFTAVKKMHDDYSEVCAGHCAAIMAARERTAPPAEMAALEATCVNGMLEHFRRVAALLPAGEGERYLALVLPRVANYDHAGAPTVKVSR
jgi:hypothetical protein